MFDSFRGDFGYSYYGERRTSASVDVPLAVVVYTCVLISIATIVAAVGIRGQARWYTLIRVVYSLAVGSTLLLCLFGDCWIDGVDKKIHVPYIYRSDAEISGQVGLNIGLQKINITLKGTFNASKGSVKYNEAIPFNGAIGSVADMREFLDRGLPQPVLTVVEFFSIDVGGLRWGRSFATAGYFAYILLLTAFSFWILANIMLCSVIFYGGALFTLTGVTMMLTSIVYHCLQPTTKLRFFCSDSEFHLYYGICFWAVLLMGVLTTVIGLIILMLDTKMPRLIQKFFLLEDGVEEIDDVFETKRNSIAPVPPLYKKNELRRQSAPTLMNSFLGHTDIQKSGSLYSVAEVESTEMTPPIRRSETNPSNLRMSYSLESLQQYSERNTFKPVSKDEKQYKSNPLFEQNEKTGVSNIDIYAKKKMGTIPGRLQSAMSLESIPSIPDDRALSCDSGVENAESESMSPSISKEFRVTNDSDDSDGDENIDVSMFEVKGDQPKNNNCHLQDKEDENNSKNNRVFTIDIDEKEDNEEERLKGIYIDMTSVYP